MSKGTAEALKVEEHYRVHIIYSDYLRPIEDWNILPFPLIHDGADPLGFFIAYQDERFLFVPDTAYVCNRFHFITELAVECNFISEILSENIQKGYLDIAVGKRVRRNHMSLETLINMLKANDLSKCRKIHLLHLSNNNSSEEMMRGKVQEEIEKKMM